MNPIHSEAGLAAAIEALEVQRTQEAIQLKTQLQLTYDHLQPINVIKRTFHEVSSSSELKTQMITSSVGMALGYMSKSLYVGKSSNLIRKMIGAAIMFGISDLISNNPELIHSAGKTILRWITSRNHARQSLLVQSTETPVHE